LPAPAGKPNNRTVKSPEQVVVAASARPAEDQATAGNGPNEASAIQPISRDEVARLAYSYWDARGGEGGSAEEDWLRAEQALRARKSKGQI
jgi:hypothetical protein